MMRIWFHIGIGDELKKIHVAVAQQITVSASEPLTWYIVGTEQILSDSRLSVCMFEGLRTTVNQFIIECISRSGVLMM